MSLPPPSSRAALRRAALVAAAVACALVGAGVAAAFDLLGARFVGLGGAWAALAMALALEPGPRGPGWRGALVALAAALGGAAVGLWTASADAAALLAEGGTGSLGAKAACNAATGAWPSALASVGLALLPGPCLVLGVRRARRQLEWQAGATSAAVLLAALALAPRDLDHPARALGLLIAGLPIGCGAYLLDRRVLGAEAMSAPPAPDAVLARRAGLLALALGALAWSALIAAAGPRLLRLSRDPACPDLRPLLEDLRARQAVHVARTGAPARTLGALEGVAPDVAGGSTQGHVLRYARLDDRRWVVTADPVPARVGWPSLRLVGPDGDVEEGLTPFRLEAP